MKWIQIVGLCGAIFLAGCSSVNVRPGSGPYTRPAEPADDVVRLEIPSLGGFGFYTLGAGTSAYQWAGGALRWAGRGIFGLFGYSPDSTPPASTKPAGNPSPVPVVPDAAIPGGSVSGNSPPASQ